MSEPRDSSAEEKTKKLALRSLWQIREKFPVNFAPSVEGLVAGTKWRDNLLSVILITPAFQKLGGTWAEASILIRPTSSFSRKPLPSYDFPFPSDKRIVQEVLKANGNLEILQEVVSFLNKTTSNPLGQGAVNTEPSSSSWEIEKENQSHDADELQILDGNVSPSILLAETSAHITKEEFFSEDLMNKLATELSRRISIDSTSMNHERREASPKSPKSTSSSTAKKKGVKVSSKKLRSKKHHRKSSSSSSSSSSDSSSSTSEVGSVNKKRGKGWFQCPFSTLDSRQITLPRTTMRGRHEERKMIRKALHNLYSHFTTLKWYVDSLKVESSTGAFKPFANDLLWLSHHARAFLELLVRASPMRNYPELLDEKVRKWMRKKRIGMSAQFGPVPVYLSDATVTDAGIQIKGGWATAARRDTRPFSAPNGQNFRPKQPSAPGQPNDRKPPVPIP